MTALTTERTSVDLDRWPALAPVRGSLPGRVRARIARGIFRKGVSRLRLRVLLPDGQVWGAGTPNSPTMLLLDPGSFFTRVGADGLIGFGESYLHGDFDSDDLAGVLTELCREVTTLVPQWMQRLRSLYVARKPSHELNTPQQSRGNVARHYDLSNDMFAAFLDETMSYSSALFVDGNEDLPGAQAAKIDRLLDTVGVGEGTRLLEIGTGWGELAIRAARRGSRVRSVTLSAEQLQLARERVRAAGLDDLVQIDLCDYRDLADDHERYDAVVSVEMIEAVGREFWPTYFETIDSVLAPGGRVAIQAITMSHERMLATRDTWTWIHKYIFPGGCLPSVEAVDAVTREHTGLRLVERFPMGSHYARTLRIWDERFSRAHDRIADLRFDEVFERMWHFYLCYSEAGFAAGYIDVQQLTFTREDR